MRIKQLKFLAIVTFLCSGNFQVGKAQIPDQVFDYGDIPRSHIEMAVYEEDPSASAVVLFDKGNSEIRYSNRKGFQLYTTRHKRIKILADEGTALADISIRFRHEDPEQDLKKLKATAYNVLGNGDLVATDARDENFFVEEETKNWSLQKISIPNVSKGSIIEFYYEMEMDFSLWYPTWYFQTEIPTMWSEYTVKVPEFFVFSYQTKGYENLFFEDSKNYNSRMGSDFQSGKELYFAMKDVKALPEEPFIKSRKAYEARLEFQFTSVKVPGGRTYLYAQGWEHVIADLLKHNNFGRKLRINDDMKRDLQMETYGVESDPEKMRLIYNLVVNRMEWDGYNGIYLEKSTTKLFEEGKGSASEINMVLLQLLKEAGLNAYPLITSTHRHGEINTLIGVIDQFNYALVYVDMGEQAFILDATDPHRPYNLLPEHILGTQGLLVYEDQVFWIPINNTGQNASIKTVIMNITESGIQGSIRDQNTGYFARDLRENYDASDSVKSLQEFLFDQGSFHKVTKVSGVEDGFENGFTYQLEFENSEQQRSDIIYFNPMIVEQMNTNPFSLDERFFPVDYLMPFQKMVSMNITVPAGWKIDEMPKPIIYRMPGNTAEFQRILQAGNGSVMMRYILKVKKAQFSPSEYAALKDMYDQLVTTHAEQIVIVKE